VAGVHYYYLPDLEVYYDVWNHEFIYLDDGSWAYSSALPPYYNNYDLNNAYVVVLDSRIHQPWMHHQLYASHYPRYFYRSVRNRYIDNDKRWFNENHPARSRSTSTGSVNAPPPTRVNPNNDNQPVNAPPPTRVNPQPVIPAPDKRANTGQNNNNGDNARKSQPAQYSGKQVGQPVKVRRNMTAPRQTPNTTKGNTDSHPEGTDSRRR